MTSYCSHAFSTSNSEDSLAGRCPAMLPFPFRGLRFKRDDLGGEFVDRPWRGECPWWIRSVKRSWRVRNVLPVSGVRRFFESRRAEREGEGLTLCTMPSSSSVQALSSASACLPNTPSKEKVKLGVSGVMTIGMGVFCL